MAQLVKNHMQCKRPKFDPSQEDPLEKGLATHSSILAWRIPWTEEPGGLQSLGLQRVRHDKQLSTHIHVFTGVNGGYILPLGP